MSIEFPRLVFQDGGKERRPGGFYSYLLVEDEVDYRTALSIGWYATLPDALEKKPVEADSDSSAPTRAELEAKAAELGIKHHPSIGDANLSKKIEEVLKG